MEHATFEQAVEVVKALPAEDRGRLSEWLNSQEQLDKTTPSPLSTLEERETRFQNSLQWLEKNKAAYLGQWVALDGGRLLAAGKDGKQVYAKAVATGVTVPLLQQINAEDDLPFGGW